jgi:hypothetical protein
MGPTVLGPVNIPTVVTTYSEYKAVYGATFISGGLTAEYLTSIAALNYFNQGGKSLLVTRIATGSYTAATASVSSAVSTVASTYASASFVAAASDTGSYKIVQINVATPYGPIRYEIVNYPYLTVGQNILYPGLIYLGTGDGNGNTTIGSVAAWVSAVTGAINLDTTTNIGANFNTTGSGTTLTIKSDYPGATYNNYSVTHSLYYNQFGLPQGVSQSFANGSDGATSTAFTLATLSTGQIMNNATASATNGALPSGSVSNVRWEITSANTGSGLFTVIVRRGDDYNNSKTVLETWSNLSLDPNQNNYISYVIGDQYQTVKTDGASTYLQTVGNYPNKSSYIRVDSVALPTPNYLDQTGTPNTTFKSYIPVIGSGSLNGGFSGASGAVYAGLINLFESIPDAASISTSGATNTQGVFAADYNTAIALLSNKDAYDFNVIYAPGLTAVNAISQIQSIISLAADRGDNIAVVDMVGYGKNLSTVISQAQSFDNSYAATYWPWIQIRSTETGKLNFIPASTLVPAVYEYNDTVAAEWWAPAGLNRGAMTSVLQPERKLTIADRNTLYSAKVNPIATFTGVGTVIYGQKTLQAIPSALDRVNVRRLLISLKRYIGQIGETLVFEPNTQVTRNKFLNQVNPYLETVQQKQGLYSFQVVMDDTNNTPDTIDRNILIGSIYLQPTKVAEFIQLTFNILPTGATFN